jgi:hypothetical protein
MRTLKELAQEALQVQNASNILGITRSYAIALVDLKEALAAAGQPCGSDALNLHPINHVWVSKISSLSQVQFFQHVPFDEVEKLANS